MNRYMFVLCCLVACSDPPGAPDAGVPPLDAYVSSLGKLCPFTAGGGGATCPAGNTCTIVAGYGSTTTGYCTPPCDNKADCLNGWVGDPGLSPSCNTADHTCSIVCTTARNGCPTGMTCVQASTSGIVWLCVAP